MDNSYSDENISIISGSFEKDILNSLVEKVSSIPVWNDYSEDEKRALISVYVDKRSVAKQCDDIEKLKEFLFTGVIDFFKH